MRLYIPWGDLRSVVINHLHDARCSGCLGTKKAIDLVKRNFYWPTLEKDVMEYVETSDEYQQNKQSNQRMQGMLHPLEIPNHRWEKVSVNLITHLPKNQVRL